MIRLENDSQNQFAQIITTRVDAELFDPGVLEQIVQLSGGSPRQLLRIANQCFLDAEPNITSEIFKDVKKRLEIERIRPLTEPHRKLLRDKNFDDVSDELLDMLFVMNVMEYNGDHIERKINPILADFVQ